MKRPEYFGNLPCLPNKKKPCLIKEDDFKDGIFSPEIPEMSNFSTVAVSTNELHCGFLEMGPGSNWYFVDEHLGDETYYIISGNLTELECVTGDCVEANKGDTLFIPMGCKHKGYNFSTDKLRAFWVVAPGMWPEETDMSFRNEDIRILKNSLDKYNLNTKSEELLSIKKEFKLKISDVNQLGKFPLEGKVAREKPIYYYLMNESNCLTTIYGLKNPMRIRFFVSNDFLHVGEFYLPSGGVGSRTSEINSHNGDMAIYCINGPITIFLPDSIETFRLSGNNIMYIPPKTKYQIINYNSEPIVGYFAISSNF